MGKNWKTRMPISINLKFFHWSQHDPWGRKDLMKIDWWHPFTCWIWAFYLFQAYIPVVGLDSDRYFHIIPKAHLLWWSDWHSSAKISLIWKIPRLAHGWRTICGSIYGDILELLMYLHYDRLIHGVHWDFHVSLEGTVMLVHTVTQGKLRFDASSIVMLAISANSLTSPSSYRIVSS